MGGKGSGGARLGAGRPLIADGRPRSADGRRKRAHACRICGKVRQSSGRDGMCRTCFGLHRAALKARTCVVCGVLFIPRNRHSVTCGVACGKARSRQAAEAKRTSTESVRVARRRSSALRRKRIGTTQRKGRWRLIGPRDEWRCWLCGHTVDAEIKHPHPMSPSVDHVQPIVLGGADTDDNLRLAHFSCNSRRGDRAHIVKLGNISHG